MLLFYWLVVVVLVAVQRARLVQRSLLWMAILAVPLYFWIKTKMVKGILMESTVIRVLRSL